MLSIGSLLSTGLDDGGCNNRGNPDGLECRAWMFAPVHVNPAKPHRQNTLLVLGVVYRTEFLDVLSIPDFQQAPELSSSGDIECD